MATPHLDRGRRSFLKMLAAGPLALATFWALLQRDEVAAAEELLVKTSPGKAEPPIAATPECGDDDDPTPSQTAGPFFTARSPQRTSLLEPGVVGERLSLTGRVYSTDCRPIPGALLDFWQADAQGEYDNEGYKLRGHQMADDQGRYSLETIVPGLYGGRTRHIHVRVQAPRGRILTTQLYFPEEPRNRRDGIYRSDLLMALGDSDEGKQGRFNFVLDVN